MKTLRYNDTDFLIGKTDGKLTIYRVLADGSHAVVGTGLFADVSESQAQECAQALVETIFPVGVHTVGPDVNHPHAIGDINIVGPDVGHPNFVYWNQDSTSFPR